jgi:exosortase
VGILSQSGTLAGIGIPLLLGATAYSVGGGRLLRACSVPLVFLLLMVPPPPQVQDRLLVGLKPIVARLAVGLLQELGYTIAGVGNRILMPAGELFVADACSGLTSLVTLTPLSAVVAYFLSHGVWRRLVVVASVVPLAILGNIARVAITVALVDRFGLGYAEGLLHETFGVSTFVVGTGALIAIAKALR